MYPNLGHSYPNLGRFFIPSNSPLIGKIGGLKAGEYNGHYVNGELFFESLSKSKSNTSPCIKIKIPFEQLIIILLHIKEFDKYGYELERIMENISRAGWPKGTTTHPAHHVIPLGVFRRSLLVLTAMDMKIIINGQLFNENHPINWRQLPASFHTGDHPSHHKYSKWVEELLDDQWLNLEDILFKNVIDITSNTAKYGVKVRIEGVYQILHNKITWLLKNKLNIEDIT